MANGKKLAVDPQAGNQSSQRRCVYCAGASGAVLTREHLLSRAARKHLFRDATVFRPSLDQSYKTEPVIRDVCKTCNGGMSAIDTSGGEFARVLCATNEPTDPLFITHLSFVWVIKTLLNYGRTAARESGIDLHPDPTLYGALQRGEWPPNSAFKLHALVYKGPRAIHAAWTTASYAMLINGDRGDQFLLVSLRIRWFEAILTIPLDYSKETSGESLLDIIAAESIHPAVYPVRLPDDISASGFLFGTANGVTELQLIRALKRFGPGFCAAMHLMPSDAAPNFYERHNAYPASLAMMRFKESEAAQA